mgnify:FL=1|tara:strand:+ start:26 stop:256 length:231 start_codon:yes stop_codon:yes gene_type:complete
MTDLETRVLVQAIKDLGDENPQERVTAALYFIERRHAKDCDHAEIDSESLRKRVLEVLKEEGVRRKKMIQDILKDF